MAQAYKHPPITEAVIELRYENPFSQDTVETAARRLGDEYTFSDPESVMNLHFDIEKQKTTVNAGWEGVRLSSIDRTETVILKTHSFICSQVAPYGGWEAFQGRAVRAWQVWKKAAGYTRITRVGLRYINRIDIPLESNEPIRIEDYLGINPNLPMIDPMPMSGYAMQIVQPLSVDECTVTMNSSSVPSPLLSHASFALDLDVYRETNLPHKDEDIWDLVANMRQHKNRIFESLITDRARELFNK